MLKMKFDFRDVFNAPRLAFSLQRIWIQFLGMSVGYIVYLLATFAAFVLNGYQFQSVWQKFGLMPCLFASGEFSPWYSWVVFALGTLFFLLAYLVTNTAVSRAVYMMAKGNSFYSWREAFAFAFRKIWSILLTPLSIAVLVGFMVLGSALIGLLGKIPVVGEIGISLFTIVWFIGALMIFFLAIIIFMSIIMAPSILATTDEDAFEAVFQVFSLTWNQPWRLMFYEALSIVLSFAGFAVFAFAVKKAIVIMNALFINFMGADYINLCNNGQAMVQNWTVMFKGMLDSLCGGFTPAIFYSHEFFAIPTADLAGSVVIASWIYAISLVILGGWVIAYGISTFTSGITLSYIVLRKNKDQENLLERHDAEEEEDNEPEEKTEEAEEKIEK